MPQLTAWYKRCYDECEAVQKVWRGELTMCEATVIEGGKKQKETKEEKKAREKARKKEKDAAKKAAQAEGGPAAVSTSGVRAATICCLHSSLSCGFEFVHSDTHMLVPHLQSATWSSTLFMSCLSVSVSLLAVVIIILVLLTAHAPTCRRSR